MSARLLYAVRSGDAELVREQLGAGAPAGIRDPESGLTALMIAAGRGDLAVVRALLDAGADVHTADTRAGATALHKACQGGSLEVVRALVEAGAFIDAVVPTTGHTPLLEAFWYKWPEIVGYLLDRDAGVNLSTHYGFSMKEHFEYIMSAQTHPDPQQRTGHSPYDPGHVAQPEPGSNGRTVEVPGLLIAGSWRAARGGHTRDVVCPADSAFVARVPQAGPDDIDDAVRAARAAFDDGPWPRMSGRERAQILYDAADLIERDSRELARRQGLETGKPVRYGLREDGPFAAMAMRYFAALASRSPVEARHADAPAATYTLREPLGVVAALTACHHPVAMAAAILAPALAAGSAVVYKPSETAPLCALKLAELCCAAGVPDGVLNVVTGPGALLGPVLAGHPGVDKAAYAGGTAAGREVAAACARALVPADLDIGAPNVHVVFADACLSHAARTAAAAALPGRGEFRTAGARILVHRPIYRAFTEALAEQVRSFEPGDPLDPATLLGPVARRGHAERLAGYVDWAASHGSRLIAGGGVEGLYHRATVLAPTDPGVAARMPEVFAPLAFVLPFDELGDAVTLANAAPGALNCTVYTTDVKRAHGVVGAVTRGRLPHQYLHRGRRRAVQRRLAPARIRRGRDGPLYPAEGGLG